VPAFPPDTPAPTDGRYHRAGASWPLYAALEPETAWVEWHAATRGAVDPAGVTRTLWRLDVADLPVLDLRDERVRDALGVTVDQLTGSWSDSQPIADRARELGARGMVVPSAARPGAWSLVAFPEGWAHMRVVDSRRARPSVPPEVGKWAGAGE